MRVFLTVLVAVGVLWTPAVAVSTRRATFDFVQAAEGHTTGASATAVFAGNITNGNTVVVGALFYTSDTSAECHDAQGAYTYIANDNTNMKMFYGANRSSAGDTITCTGSGTLGVAILAAEYEGNLVFDKKSFNTSTSTSLTSGSTATTAQANELLVGFGCQGVGFLTEDGAYTNRISDVSDGTFCINSLADDVVSSTGTYAFTGTISVSSAYLAYIATFYEASGVVSVLPAIINSPIRGGGLSR